MENVIHYLTLDLTGPDMCPTVEVQRGDSARSLIISLTQGGRPYWIDEGLTAALYATKPNGDPLFNACTIEKNRIRYDFTPQTANVAGAFDCEIWLVAGDKRELNTPKFTIAVDERMRTDDVIPESAPEYTAITEMVAAGTAMIEELRKALAGLEGVEEILTQARAAAEAASNSEVAARGHARTAAKAAEDALGSAGRAYASEQAAVTAAGDAQVQAETAQGYTLRAEAAAKRAEEAAAGVGTGGNGSGQNANQYAFLNGLKYYALGDSITEIQGTTTDPKKFGNWYTTDLQGRDLREITVSGYVQAIESRYGLTATNYGKSGHTLVADYGTLAGLDYSDVALVTIAYGVNDARTSVPLGTINSTDLSTFAGALNMLLRKIYTDNPECRVLVLAPLQRLYVSGFGIATPNENGKYLIDFVNMCRAIAEKRATAFLDQYRCTGINQTNLYYYTVEGVHPVNQGFARIKNAVVGILDELFAVEYNPFGTMTNTGDTEPEEPETGGGGDAPDAPPEEDVQGTEVDITDKFTYEGYSIDGWAQDTNATDYQTARFIPLPGKTYTIVTYVASTMTDLRICGGSYSFEKADGSGIQGNYTNAAVTGLTAAGVATSENGFADIDGVTYKKVKIVFTSAATVTGEKWLNIACVDACVDHVTCHYV